MEYTMSNDYWIGVEKEARERLKALRIMLDSLDAQRAERAQQILELEQLIRSLTPLTSENSLDATEKIVNNFGLVSSVAGLDLAEACRKVLEENDRYMSPREVRDMLEVNDYHLAQHTNPLASIHGVLKRLVESGDVLRMASSRGVIYKWNTSDFKHSALKWIGQRRRATVPTEEDAAMEARRLQGERNRAQAQAAMAKAKKPTVPAEPKSLGERVMEIGAKALDDAIHPKKG